MPAELASELGQLFAEWGFVEAQMDALLSATVGHARIGRVLREELKTSRQRRAVITKLIEVTTPPDLRQQVQMIVGDFNRLAAERGLYAHSQWGLHSAYPGEGMMLLDYSTLEALYPDIDAIIAGEARDFAAQVKENSALVSVEDVQRCRTALRKLSDRLSTTVGELMFRTNTERIRSLAALERLSTEPLETNPPAAPGAPSE